MDRLLLSHWGSRFPALSATNTSLTPSATDTVFGAGVNSQLELSTTSVSGTTELAQSASNRRDDDKQTERSSLLVAESAEA